MDDVIHNFLLLLLGTVVTLVLWTTYKFRKAYK